MNRKTQLLTALRSTKNDAAMYRDLLNRSTAAVREIETELAELYTPSQHTDTAQVRREILGRMKAFPKKRWALSELSDLLPEYDYDLIGRQLRYLVSKGVVLWSGGRGLASFYAIKVKN